MTKVTEKPRDMPKSGRPKAPSSGIDKDFDPAGFVDPIRVVRSLTSLATICGVDPNTIRKWHADGLPALQSGSRGARGGRTSSWTYDIKAVMEWRLERAYRQGHADATREAAAEAERAGRPGRGSPTEADDGTGMTAKQVMRMNARKLQADVDFAEARAGREQLRLETDRSAVAPIDVTVATFAFHLRTASQALQTLKSKAVAKLVQVGIALDEAERLIADPIDRMCDGLCSADALRDPLAAGEDDDDEDAGRGVGPDAPADTGDDDPEADDAAGTGIDYSEIDGDA